MKVVCFVDNLPTTLAGTFLALWLWTSSSQRAFMDIAIFITQELHRLYICTSAEDITTLHAHDLKRTLSPAQTWLLWKWILNHLFKKSPVGVVQNTTLACPENPFSLQLENQEIPENAHDHWSAQVDCWWLIRNHLRWQGSWSFALSLVFSLP